QLQPAAADTSAPPVVPPAGLEGNTVITRMIEGQITAPVPSTAQIGAAVTAVLGLSPADPGLLATVLPWWTEFLAAAEDPHSDAHGEFAQLRVDLLDYMIRKYASQEAQVGGAAVARLMSLALDAADPGRGDCPAIEPWHLAEEGEAPDGLGDAVDSFEFLPYHAMRWATGTMGHPGRQWVDVRAERERGEYRWEYVMFAAFDAADGCGWAFWPAADEPDGTGTGEPQVWYVEDSLPEEQVGTFAEWLDKMVGETLTGLAGLGLVDAPTPA
ncbi:MAG TPA: hypothetical protein VGM10_30385, partial [Actinocrinis sp.]